MQIFINSINSKYLYKAIKLNNIYNSELDQQR